MNSNIPHSAAQTFEQFRNHYFAIEPLPGTGHTLGSTSHAPTSCDLTTPWPLEFGWDFSFPESGGHFSETRSWDAVDVDQRPSFSSMCLRSNSTPPPPDKENAQAKTERHNTSRRASRKIDGIQSLQKRRATNLIAARKFRAKEKHDIEKLCQIYTEQLGKNKALRTELGNLLLEASKLSVEIAAYSSCSVQAVNSRMLGGEGIDSMGVKQDIDQGGSLGSSPECWTANPPMLNEQATLHRGSECGPRASPGAGLESTQYENMKTFAVPQWQGSHLEQDYSPPQSTNEASELLANHGYWRSTSAFDIPHLNTTPYNDFSVQGSTYPYQDPANCSFPMPSAHVSMFPVPSSTGPQSFYDMLSMAPREHCFSQGQMISASSAQLHG